MGVIVDFTLTFDAKELYHDISEDRHRIAFNRSANTATHETLQAMADAVSKKWYLNVEESTGGLWQVKSVKDGKAGSRDGTMSLKPVFDRVKSGSINIRFKGTAISLGRFVTDWSPAGTRSASVNRNGKSYVRKAEPKVRILRGHPSRQIRGSFASTMYSGHRGVFQKRTDRKKGIFEMRTITLPSMLEQVGFDTTLDGVWDGFADTFSKELAKVA